MNINIFLFKCFSMSAEIGDHKKDHSYFLKTNVHFPIFDGEKYWSYKEELLLLQFIEQYGFGNWDDIAKHLPTRTARGNIKKKKISSMTPFLDNYFG